MLSVIPQHTSGYWLSSSIIVILSLWGITIPEPLYFCLVLILAVGIPHGALDAVIIACERNSTRSITYVICLYLSIIGLCYLAWYWASYWVLWLLLLSSAYHFGADWEQQAITRILVGTGLLSSMYIFHPLETLNWLSQIAPSIQATPYLYILTSMSFLAYIWIVAIKLYQGESQYSECLMLIIMSKLLGPISFFTLYFCTLHSPRHYHYLILKKHLTYNRIPYLVAFTLASYGIAIISYLLFFTGKNTDNAMVSNILILLLILNIPHNLLAKLLKLKKAHRD